MGVFRSSEGYTESEELSWTLFLPLFSKTMVSFRRVVMAKYVNESEEGKEERIMPDSA